MAEDSPKYNLLLSLKEFLTSLLYFNLRKIKLGLQNDTRGDNLTFKEQVKSVVVGENNIIYNYYYYGYRKESKPIPADADDDNLPCPYRGLHIFYPNDAEYFLGRDVFVKKLFQAATDSNCNFIPVLGASGSGKSSVILAGLVPTLEQEQEGKWKFTHFRPSNGNDPFYALAEALVPLYRSESDSTDEIIQASKLGESLKKKELSLAKVFSNIQQKYPNHKILLIADQFEELYTQYSDIECRRFLDCLLSSFSSDNSGVSSSIVLVVTMRADFLRDTLSYPLFASMLNQNQSMMLGAMSREELKEVIEKPAQKLGVRFEAGLVERILNDVRNEPGNLPLLEFALTKLWQEQKKKKLTHEAYETIDRVQGALAKYADDTYKNLTVEDKERARSIFIQLVHPGEGTEDTKRRANPKELGEENWKLVIRKGGLADSRLVITDRRLVVTSCNNNQHKTVEIVHEALIQNWGQLREWMEVNREFRIWQERLKARRREWKEGKGELLSKTRLKIAQEWLKSYEREIGEEEKEFISDSMKKHKTLWWSRVIISTLSLVGISVLGTLYWKEKVCDVGDKIGQDCFRFIVTSGDSRLFVGTTNAFLQDGIKNFAMKNFQEAEQDFAKAQNAARYDPIPLIYYNNAKALKKGNPYKLAVVVPVDAHEEISRNMLLGVAYAQEEFNKKRENSEAPLLEIVIANDRNNEKIAKEIATRLIKENVLGIIGHRSSGSSLAALPIYQETGIAMVSPTSGSTELDKDNNVFFRAVASNEKFAEDFYEYTKENCFNENKDNYVWIIYDSDAEYSSNLKEEFELQKSEELKNQFIEISFNDLLEKDEEGLKEEIPENIEQEVKCSILLPSTKTTYYAISVVSAQSQLKLPREQKMQFLSSLPLHNDETLKKDGSSFGEDLKIIVPIPLLNDRTILETLQNRWERNVNWRTYTSYKATFSLIEGIEKLDDRNPDEKNTIDKKRKIVFDYLKNRENSSDKDLESCLMDSKDIQNNRYDPSKCIQI